jgi:hypothetical protein
MISVKKRILRSLYNNRLNPTNLGERKWNRYFIRVAELIWERNHKDGYQLEIYNDSSKLEHLATIVI